jgi:hypothetical protein
MVAVVAANFRERPFGRRHVRVAMDAEREARVASRII